MKISRIFFFGLLLLLLLILTPGEMRAAPSAQVEPPREMQIVLVLDVSGSMATPVFTGIVPEDLLSLLLRMEEMQNIPEFIRLEDLVEQAENDPAVLAAQQAIDDAYIAMDDYVTSTYGMSLADVRANILAILLSAGCDGNMDSAIATADGSDAIDFYLTTDCPAASNTPELRASIDEQIPYIDDPEYLALRQVWDDAFPALDEALEASGVTTARDEFEAYKASQQFGELQDEIDRLVAEYNIPSRLGLAKAAAINLIDFSFLDYLNTGIESLFGLVTFSNQAMHMHSLTRNHDLVTDTIKTLSPQEQTNIGDALTMGLNELQNNADEDQPQLVILLSDGHANVGMTSAEILAAIPPRANSMDVTICTAGFADLEIEVDFVLLEGLARQTDGEYLFTNSATDLGSFFVACREAAAGKEIAGQITGGVDAGDVSEVGSVEIMTNTCEANFTLNHISGSPMMELLDPTGMPIDLEQEGVSYQSGDNIQLLSVMNPSPGEWVIKVSNDDPDGTASLFSILVSTSECEGDAPVVVEVAPEVELPFLLSESGMTVVTGVLIAVVVVLTGIVFVIILRRQRVGR